MDHRWRSDRERGPGATATKPPSFPDSERAHEVRPTVTVLGTFNRPDDFRGLEPLARAFKAELVDVIVGVTHAAARPRRIALVRAGLRALDAGEIRVARARCCNGFPELRHDATIEEGLWQADGDIAELADPRCQPDAVYAVVFRGGMRAYQDDLARKTLAAVAYDDGDEVDPCSEGELPYHPMLESYVVTAADPVARIGAGDRLPDAFERLHAPERWAGSPEPSRAGIPQFGAALQALTDILPFHSEADPLERAELLWEALRG